MGLDSVTRWPYCSVVPNFDVLCATRVEIPK
jgi:hypothetical protein